MNKARFANETLRLAFQVGQMSREVADLISVYNDRGYATTNPIGATDINTPVPGYPVLDAPLTVEQWNEIASMLVSFQRFMVGLSVTPADWDLVVNKYRQDV